MLRQRQRLRHLKRRAAALFTPPDLIQNIKQIFGLERMADVKCPHCSEVLFHTTPSSDGASALIPTVEKVKGEAPALCRCCGRAMTVQLIVDSNGEATFRLR
jgi:hypothetical protein